MDALPKVTAACADPIRVAFAFMSPFAVLSRVGHKQNRPAAARCVTPPSEGSVRNLACFNRRLAELPQAG
jgi:hypothetical protein